ncbi:MAG: hypothetical protein EOP59_14195 [Sphingomonadales bacterium]|nr:MAG: hypothetical protein EOP59_14195 [Sphingomonadales bacterium]
MAQLEQLCAGQPEALERLRTLDAQLRIGVRDFAGALALLDKMPLDPESPLTGTNALNLLRAASGTRDPLRFARARDTVRQAHDRLVRKKGLTPSEPIETKHAAIDGYRGAAGNWLFIAWPKDGGMPISLFSLRVRSGSGDKFETDAKLQACGQSKGADMPQPDAGDAAFVTAARLAIEESDMWETGSAEYCVQPEKTLPGFDGAPYLTGTEYSGSAPTEDQLAVMLEGSKEQQDAAVMHILAHLDSIEPFTLAKPVAILMQRGDMLRASFLFYFWQIRTIPWAKHGSASSEGALRSAINATIGPPINEWIASDRDAMIALAGRVIAFERRAPLYPGRPDGISAETWARTVAEGRAAYEQGFREATSSDSAAAGKWAEQRAKNGLRNGPLENPGTPLPEDWR